MDTSARAEKRQRIALCHLESLVCLPAINDLFGEIGDEIGLVILSDRFGGKHGSALRQLSRNLRQHGLRLTLWLGFDIVAAQLLSGIAELLRCRSPSLKSARALARAHGAILIESADVNEKATLEAIRTYAPDIVLVLNFDQILRESIIDIPTVGVVNVHPSLLPEFRGPCPVFWALYSKKTRMGVTIHVIEDRSIDSGPILHQVVTQVPRQRSVAEVTSKLFQQGALAIPRALERLGGKESYSHLKPQPQDTSYYHGFPQAWEVQRARSEGLRFLRYVYLARLAAAALGIGARSINT